MLSQTTVNFVEREGFYHVYVYRLSVHGRKRRVGGLRSFFIPRKGPQQTPSDLLRALATEMELPVSSRWMPPPQAGSAPPQGATGVV